LILWVKGVSSNIHYAATKKGEKGRRRQIFDFGRRRDVFYREDGRGTLLLKGDGYMDVRKIFLAILAASAGILAERIDSADADYCFDFRNKPQSLLLVKTHKDLEIRDTVVAEDISYKVIFVLSQIDLTKELEFDSRGYAYGMGWSSSNDDKTMPKPITKQEIFEQLSFQKYMYLDFNERPEYDVKKELLQFKNKIVDGKMRVSVKYAPSIDTTYNLKFRAKITGECTADFLRNYDRSLRR
jgi:hypothetical protein